MTTSLTYDQMEAHTFAIQWRTAQASIALKARRSILTKISIAKDLLFLVVEVRRLLDGYYSPAVVKHRIFEEATQEQRASLAAKMEDGHQRIEKILTKLKGEDFRSITFEPFMPLLEQSTEEWGRIVRALRDNDSVMIVLSRRDQDKLIRTLLEPVEKNCGNDTFVEAFHRYHD
jgi:hypothetical protein